MCARADVALAAAFEEEDRASAKVCRCPVGMLLLLKLNPSTDEAVGAVSRRIAWSSHCGRCGRAAIGAPVHRVHRGVSVHSRRGNDGAGHDDG